MKILLAVRIPAYFHSLDPNELVPSFQSQNHWLRALKSLRHDVKVFRYSDSLFVSNDIHAKLELKFEEIFPKAYSKCRLLLNRFYQFNPNNYIRSTMLLRIIEKFKPDLIIITKGISELVTFPFIFARKKKIPIILLSGENPNIAATKFEKNNAGLFNWIIVNDKSHEILWKKLGAKNVLALPYVAIDPKVHRKVALTKKENQYFQSEVVFAGTLSHYRQRLLVKLVKENIPIILYGHIPSGIRLNRKLTDAYRGEAWGDNVTKIYNAAKIALNPILPSMPTGGNLRTFEIPGCGAFELTNRCSSKWFIPGKEIMTYSSEKDLINKIWFYLDNPKKRKKIAIAGYKKAHQKHTYKLRFNKIVSLA